MNATLKAWKRDPDMKPNALRKEGWIPATVCAPNAASLHVKLKNADVKSWAKHNHTKTTLWVDGHGEILVSTKEIQKNALGTSFLHLSFHALDKNKKSTVTLPIEFVGHAPGKDVGGLVTHYISEIRVKGYPKDLPEKVSIDVSSLKIGDMVHVRDIVRDYHCEFFPDDMEKVIAKCEHSKIEIVEPVKTVEETIVPVDAAPTAPTPAPHGTKEEKKAA